MQAKAADMYAKLQSSRSYLYHSCEMFDAGLKSNKDSASVFLHAARNSVQVALECMQIFGGNGYINEYPCGRLVRDSKLYEIGGGTNEIRQMLMGKELLKEHA